MSKELLKQFINEVIKRPFDMSLPGDLLNIATAFKHAGYKLFVVGGSVRDALLGKEPKDFDVATDAVPDEVIKVAGSLPRHKVIEVGKSFGVVKVVTPENNEYEIATFRKDLGKGRRPDSVEFTSIDKDVMRRDLTINALFYDIDKREIVDYVGGIEDIEKNVVKAVGDASERFDEDRLRILRALRFAGRMGSDLDPATSKAIELNNSLAGVSPERIRDEFIKGIKSARNIGSFLSLFDKYDMWPQVFPGLKTSTGQDTSVSTRGIDSKNVLVVIAMLLDANDSTIVLKKLNTLKYTAQEASQVSFLLRFRDLSVDNAFKLKRAFHAAHMSDDDIIEYAHQRGEPSSKLLMSFIEYEPSVSGEELLATGFTGAALGRELERRETLLFRQLSSS